MQPSLPLVAMPADTRARMMLRETLLIHAAPLELVSKIVKGPQRDASRFGTWNITLKSGQGWSPGKWSRDYSVLDIPFAAGAQD